MSMNAVHINIVMTVGFFYDFLGAVVLGLDVAASKFLFHTWVMRRLRKLKQEVVYGYKRSSKKVSSVLQ